MLRLSLTRCGRLPRLPHAASGLATRAIGPCPLAGPSIAALSSWSTPSALSPLLTALAPPPSAPASSLGAPPRRALSSSAEVSSAMLDLPGTVGPLALHLIRDNLGSRPVKRRIGRGVGSGRGRHCGRGMKGRKARAGNHGLLKQDGGTTRLQKGLPKMGDWRPRLEYTYINLFRLQDAVRSGRLPVPEGRPISVKDLFDAKLVTLRQRHAGVKLLGAGHDSFDTPLHLEVQLATQKSIEAVERAGGSVTSVYYSRLTLRALLKPHRFEAAPVGKRHGVMRPRPALPPPKLMSKVYLSERHRGYLRHLLPGDVVRPEEHPRHVDLSKRQKPRYPGWAAADQAAIAAGRPYIKSDGTRTDGGSPPKSEDAPSARQLLKDSPRRRKDRPYVPGE